MNIQTGIINIRGKEYQTVALRVQLFRETCPEHGLTTDIIARDEDCVVMRATITAPDSRVLATGHSEEYRKSSQINKTSALENAETSAIGRALAAFGFGGTEFATANEVQNAIHQQGQPAERQSEERAVSSPPDDVAKWTEPGSIYSGIHKLKAGLRDLSRQLEGCGDSDMVYALCATNEWREFARVAELYAPHYLHGGDPAPPEFTGLATRAHQLVTEFDAKTATGMVDLAHT